MKLNGKLHMHTFSCCNRSLLDSLLGFSNISSWLCTLIWSILDESLFAYDMSTKKFNAIKQMLICVLSRQLQRTSIRSQNYFYCDVILRKMLYLYMLCRHTVILML
jgi:hypothetical protein